MLYSLSSWGRVEVLDTHIELGRLRNEEDLEELMQAFLLPMQMNHRYD